MFSVQLGRDCYTYIHIYIYEEIWLESKVQNNVIGVSLELRALEYLLLLLLFPAFDFSHPTIMHAMYYDIVAIRHSNSFRCF